MRIAITHTRYTDFGGVERTIASLVRRYLDAGHEVHYFCHFVDGEADPRVVFHKVPNSFKAIRVLKVLSFDRWSARMVREHGPFDVVHGWSKTSQQDLYTDGSGCLRDYQDYSIGNLSNPARRWLKRMSPHQQVVESIERRRFDASSGVHVITMSHLVRDQILNRHGLPPESVEVLYNGVEPDRFRPDQRERLGSELRELLGLRPESLLLLFLANDYVRKGLDVVLEALARLVSRGGETGQRDIRLVVAGQERPARERTFKAQADALGLGDRVVWLGPRRDPERLFAGCDLFLMPTRFDAFGNVVLEAMASGTPPLVSTRAGAVEVVDDHRTGRVLHDYEDPESLAQVLGECLDDDSRRAMGQAAAKAALDYTWERYYTRTMEVCEEVAARRQRQGA